MSTDIWIKSFTHLKGRSKSDQAVQILHKIASLVKPIMRSHNWILPVLSEFFPNQDNLLGMNVNSGCKILLRLRPANAPDTFIELEEVVQTMLHELTHNVHGPHDEKFYKFLEGLQDEYDKLVRSGYSGEGFFSEGKRLGSHNVPVHMARAKALEAAEKRKRLQHLIGDGGGRRLGGRLPVRPGMSRRELAAMAAERRARDEKACGQGVQTEKEAAKTAKDSTIDLTGNDSDDEVIILDDLPTPSGSSVFASLRNDKTPKEARPNPRKRKAQPSSDHGPHRTDEWECYACTLLNRPSALQCAVCYATRPIDPLVGWTCLSCGEGGMSPDYWTCSTCGMMKTTS